MGACILSQLGLYSMDLGFHCHICDYRFLFLPIPWQYNTAKDTEEKKQKPLMLEDSEKMVK